MNRSSFLKTIAGAAAAAPLVSLAESSPTPPTPSVPASPESSQTPSRYWFNQDRTSMIALDCVTGWEFRQAGRANRHRNDSLGDSLEVLIYGGRFQLWGEEARDALNRLQNWFSQA